ncbi:FIST signal transduction protein [Pseudaquabacterium pictum]|uniref:Histidine kinase n=1 Tax=Pseudaquabacterium pictum TaxID=2315236 RepID=A0A480AX41_9BURK|nr:FIST N-terminal domain-containing protein [Rubrivivax pictus]GCL64657.1 hypothetical protein AQPW35_37380 [Rubrivivax pictus]
MQTATTTHLAGQGWTQPLPTALDSAQTLVLAFGSSQLAADAPALRALVEAFPKAVVLGCSTAGEIAGPEVNDDSLSVAVTRFDHTRLALAVAEVTQAAQSGTAGAQLAQQLRAGGEDLCAVFMLSDGLSVNGTPLVQALAQGLDAGVAISGGLAGDGSAFQRTWVLAGGRARPGCVAAVGLYGTRLQVGSGCQGGWMDFGPERSITRSEGNVLYELDGKPALDLYKSYLGELAQGLPGSALRFPLSIRRPGSDAPPLVRTILAIDEAARSLTFAGDMPQGHAARLMRTTNDSLIDSAAQASAAALAGASGSGDALVVSVSCVGRRLVLGERTEEEVESVLEAAPPGTGHVGFYSYGEISPGPAGGASDLHNQTMTVTVFSER